MANDDELIYEVPKLHHAEVDEFFRKKHSEIVPLVVGVLEKGSIEAGYGEVAAFEKLVKSYFESKRLSNG